MGKKREYTNGEVTVVWEAEKCTHAGLCAKGLPAVFRPSLRPWIKTDAAQTEAIINQVKHCPSGALSFYIKGKKHKVVETAETKVEILNNGPLLVYGTLKIVHKDGSEEIKTKTTAFCRCGASSNKPFCDGAHVKESFVG